METLKEGVKRFGYLFYVMDPRAHNYEKIDQVKDYYKEVAPLLFATVLLEQVVRYYQKKPIWRFSDTMSNAFHGFLMDLSKIPFKGAEVFVYAYIYNNYRLIDLPWDNPWTWIACWFITDFCYYWMHRMIHQVNILWAIHETHHTPEDMMFTSPMRNHIFLLPIHWPKDMGLHIYTDGSALDDGAAGTGFYYENLLEGSLGTGLSVTNFDAEIEAMSQAHNMPLYQFIYFLYTNCHPCRFSAKLTYMPMALAIPPTTYLVHYQISIIYQYWLHTEIIGKLPAPIEYMLCTPSHHRAHHGRNRRYIDKNFGGFLIIWDRIFGTFEAEDPEEKPLYGITTQMKSYNPLVVQTQPFIKLYNRIWEYDNLKDRLSVIFKGPGWSPGKPWTGNIEDIPHPAPDVPKYDPQMPLWCKYYVIVHFFFIVNGYFLLALNMSVLSKVTIWTTASFICYSSISMGFMLDNSQYGPHLEVLRCLIYFLVDRIVISEVRRFGVASVIVMNTNRTLGVLSLAYWISLYLFYNLRRIYKEKNL